MEPLEFKLEFEAPYWVLFERPRKSWWNSRNWRYIKFSRHKPDLLDYIADRKRGQTIVEYY